MKNILRVSVLAAMLTLGGCATPGNGPSPDVSSLVNQIVVMSRQVCSFAPTIGTVVSLITANPTWASVAEFAVAICNAVTAPKSSYKVSRKGVPMVGNVVIHGRFVR